MGVQMLTITQKNVINDKNSLIGGAISIYAYIVM